MNQEKIGKFIAEERKKRNITQKEFAMKLGVTDKTVSRWENGHYLPDISLFNEICMILEIDVSELLKGDRIRDIGKREVDDTTMSIVKISNDKIKKKSRKILVLSIVLFILVICGTCFIARCYFFLKNNIEDGTYREFSLVGQSVHYPARIATKDKGDGWVASFRMEYMKDDLEIPYYYSYDCENFKYDKLFGYHGTGKEIDSNGDFYTYNIDVNHPRYIFNDEFDEDLSNISKYFQKKGFNKPIKIDDLSGLILTKIDKKEVLELYNEAISGEVATLYGNYPKLQSSFLRVSITKNDYTWYIGYILNMGHISAVHLELKIDDEYLSDKVDKNTASKKELDLYEKIQLIEKNIVESQKFELSGELTKMEPFNFLDYEFTFIEEDELEY